MSKNVEVNSSTNLTIKPSYSKYFSQNIKIGWDKFYFSKNTRKTFKNGIFIILFIFIGFLISFIIAATTGDYEIGFLFRSLFGFGDFINEWLVTASILGVSALSFLFAYKSGMFNIGISGQMLAAGLAIVGLSKSLEGNNDLNKAYVLVSIVVAMLTGAFVALISGVLKNFFNISEVVSAIMINWIVFFLAKFLIVGSSNGGGIFKGDNGNSLQIIEELSLYSPYQDSGVIGSFTLFIILVLGIWFIFKFTSYGKKIIAIGKSTSSGVYAGYHTKLLQLSTFIISGAIAGILGLIVYTGNTSTRVIGSQLTLGNMLPVEGFNGIAISLVAFSHPMIVVLISLLFAMVQFANGYPTGLSELMLSFSMYAVAIFVIIYRIEPIKFLKKLLKKKNNDSHFVNDYDEQMKEYNNAIRKIIANRTIELFLSKKSIKSKSLFEKIKIYINNSIEINNNYLYAKNEIKKEIIPWYISIHKKSDTLVKENA